MWGPSQLPSEAFVVKVVMAFSFRPIWPGLHHFISFWVIIFPSSCVMTWERNEDENADPRLNREKLRVNLRQSQGNPFRLLPGCVKDKGYTSIPLILRRRRETGFGPKYFFSYVLFYGLANGRMGLLYVDRFFSTWKILFSETVLGPKMENCS